MKLIEAMKRVKEFQQKASDLRDKVKVHAADFDFEKPVYGTEEQQRETVAGWIQAHTDLVQEMAHLRVAIQRTNLATAVTIEIAGRPITKTIAEWILRRGNKPRAGASGFDGLAALDFQMWAQTSEAVIASRGLKEGTAKNSAQEPFQVHIRRYFDPQTRDAKLAEFRSEASQIDAALEVVNATTELVEG